jgi:hypothetical protein
MLVTLRALGAVRVNALERAINLEEGVRDSYAALRLHVDEAGLLLLDALEREHIYLLQANAFMEGKLQGQIEEALGE